MIGIMMDQPLEIPQEVIREYELWEVARHRMHEVYGTEPPVEFILRFDTEFTLYFRKQWIEHIMMLHHLQEKGLGRIFQGRTIYGFIPWLMGINWINPLPPHMYCPKCKRVVMHPKVKDGWDLWPKTCICGETMIPDGHNIPIEPDMYGYADWKNTIELTIRTQNKQATLDFIQEYYGLDYRIYPMKHVIEGKAFDLNSYAIIPENARIWYPVSADGVIQLPESYDTNETILSRQRALVINVTEKDDGRIHQNYRYEISEEQAKEVLQPSILKRRMLIMRHINETDSLMQLISKENYPAVDLPDEVQFPENFSGFCQQFELCINSRLWLLGARKWIMEEGVDPMELPFTASSFMELLSRYLSDSSIEKEWIRILINDINAKEFDREPFKTIQEWQTILARLSIPPWIIEYVQIATSLPAKEELIYSVCRSLFNNEHTIK